MPKETQRELSLFELANGAKPNVKRRQMSHYKMAHSVMVDVEQGTIIHLHGPDMAAHPASEQTAVVNEDWLDRLTYAIGILNDLTERHARERRHLVGLVNEVLDESCTLNDADIAPLRVKDAFRAAHRLEDVPEDLPVWDENDPPF